MSYFLPRKNPLPLLLPVLLSLLLSTPALPQNSQSLVHEVGKASGNQSSAAFAHQRKPAALLPPAFAGQPRQGNIVVDSMPSAVDAAHTGVLKEDGLVEAATAHYAGVGSTAWSVQAMRFADATGAFSAFTFYRDPAMQPESIGENAAASPSVFLVQSNATLVIVRSLGVSAGAGQGTTRTEDPLRPAVAALVNGLPKLQGPEAIAPSLPGLMPANGLQKGTLHYAIGPASYNGPLPVSAIDFNRDAEAAIARYQLRSGAGATLTLLMLPTPQIAGSVLHTIQELPDASLHVVARRSGPLVGIVSGPGVSQAEAQQLLGQIHYAANVMIDQPQGYVSEIAKTAKLLVGIAYLTVGLGVAAVVLAIFLGAGRVVVRRMRGQPDSSMNDDDFISLKL